MSKFTKINLSDAMLQRGKSPSQLTTGDNASPAVLPLSEMPMVFTLDQLRPILIIRARRAIPVSMISKPLFARVDWTLFPK